MNQLKTAPRTIFCAMLAGIKACFSQMKLHYREAHGLKIREMNQVVSYYGKK